MALEVLLSVMNLNKKDLNKMNITSKCTVINQCGKNDFYKYKNYNIYSYDELGESNSRNRAIEKSSEDILIFCDDDVEYVDYYDKLIIDEFNNNKNADIILFNIDSPNRLAKLNKKRKRVNYLNYMRYTSTRIAFRRKSIMDKNIRFNTSLGVGSKYSNGADTLFLRDSLKSGLKLYTSPVCIAKVKQDNSSWFKGYNKKYFFDKGAIFTALNKNIRHFLCFQFLLRHKYTLKNIKFSKAYKYMIEGANDYINNYIK